MGWSIKELFPKTRDKQEASKASIVLPPSVLREIVLNADHAISKESIRRLVRDGESRPTEFANAAFYMLLKAHSENIEEQHALVERAVSRLYAIPVDADEEARRAIRDLVETEISNVSGGVRVPAGKLKRMNLAGFDWWDDAYAKHAARLAADPRSVFIVGNSMLVGLSSFVRSFREANKALYVLEPSMLGNGAQSSKYDKKGNYPCGYVIYPNGSVSDLTRDFPRETEVVIVDDIREKGRTEDMIRKFWIRDGSAAPSFEPLEVIKTRDETQ